MSLYNDQDLSVAEIANRLNMPYAQVNSIIRKAHDFDPKIMLPREKARERRDDYLRILRVLDQVWGYDRLEKSNMLGLTLQNTSTLMSNAKKDGLWELDNIEQYKEIVHLDKLLVYNIYLSATLGNISDEDIANSLSDYYDNTTISSALKQIREANVWFSQKQLIALKSTAHTRDPNSLHQLLMGSINVFVQEFSIKTMRNLLRDAYKEYKNELKKIKNNHGKESCDKRVSYLSYILMHKDSVVSIIKNMQQKNTTHNLDEEKHIEKTQKRFFAQLFDMVKWHPELGIERISPIMEIAAEGCGLKMAWKIWRLNQHKLGGEYSEDFFENIINMLREKIIEYECDRKYYIGDSLFMPNDREIVTNIGSDYPGIPRIYVNELKQARKALQTKKQRRDIEPYI